MTALERRVRTFGRAPVAEWEELALAVGKPSPVPAWLMQWLARNTLWPFLILHAALLTALVAGLTRTAVVCWLLASAVDWGATRADSQLLRLLAFAGLKPGLRVALRALVLVGVLAPQSAAVGYVIVAVVVQGVWLALGAVGAWVWQSAPPLRFVPGARYQPEPLARFVRCYAAAAGVPGFLVLAEATAVVGVLLRDLGLPSFVTWLTASLAAIMAVAYGANTAAGARRALRVCPTDVDQLLGELASTRPTYLVYVSLGAAQSRYIVNQWLPVLDATPFEGLMVVREASQLAPLGSTRVPVIYAPHNHHVEQLTLDSMKVAFYLAYGERNAHLLRDPGLKHVMLQHGDSDKATSANAQARAFDQVWVAGQAAVDRYRAAGIAIADERFVVIGRPQIEPLIGADDRAPDDRPVVLYAPTFEGYYEGTSHSSLDIMGVEMVRVLLEEFPQVKVWFKPHPASGILRPSMLAAVAEIEGLLGRGDHVVVDHTDLTLVECLASADVLISDISSVTSDFMATGRPVLVTNPAGLPVNDFNAAYPSQGAFYVVDMNLAQFRTVLNLALGRDPLKNERSALRTYLLGDLPDGPQRAFDDALGRLAGRVADL